MYMFRYVFAIAVSLLTTTLWATGPQRRYIVLDDGTQVELPMPQIECPSCSHAMTSNEGYVSLRDFVPNGADGLGVYGKSAKGSVNTIGEVKVPVIMVAFSDVDFLETTTVERVQNLFNQEGYTEKLHPNYSYSKITGSVRDYYLKNSDNMFKPEFKVVGKVTASGTRASYGKNRNNKPAADTNVSGLVTEAIQLCVNQGVDFTEFVKNNNGVPLVIIYFAGVGEHAALGEEGANSIWPHYLGSPRTVGGVRFNSYFVGNELWHQYKPADDYATTGNVVVDASFMYGPGVLIHELGHALGLTDLYNTAGSNDNSGSPGYWTPMDYGQYQKNGFDPMLFSAYERSVLGWLNLTELPSEGTVEMGSRDAYLVRNKSVNTQYYILEPRSSATVSYSASDFGEGMLVWSINYNSQTWQNNTPNNKKESLGVAVLPADGEWQQAGTRYLEQTRGDLFNNCEELELYGRKLYNIHMLDDVLYIDNTPVGVETMEQAVGTRQTSETNYPLNPWITISHNKKTLNRVVR